MGFTKEEIMECTVMVFDQPPFWPLDDYTDNSFQFTVIATSFEYECTMPNIRLNFRSENPAIVDWGDGTTETLEGFDIHLPNHVYHYPGSYRVIIDGGDLSYFDAHDCSDLYSIDSPFPSLPSGYFLTVPNGCFYNCDHLTKVCKKLFSKVDSAFPINDFRSFFRNCSSLLEIPDDLFKYSPSATTFERCFDNCSSLTNIPEKLFSHNTLAENFTRCFYSCSSIEYIPEKLFYNCSNANTFESAFAGCTSLQSIPSKLFYNTSLVTNFYNTFGECTSLQSIPSGLFSHTLSVTNFSNTFVFCTSLQSIPSGLFDNTPLAINFSSTFSGCTSLQSIPSMLFYNTPSVIDFSNTFRNCSLISSAVPELWNTHFGVQSHNSCFYRCYNASNYEDIPSDWK